MTREDALSASWKQRAREAHRYVVAVIPAHRTCEELTADEWRAASLVERADFTQYWWAKGTVWFQCLTCGFPSRSASCEACDPWLRVYYGRKRAQDRQRYTERAGLL